MSSGWDIMRGQGWHRGGARALVPGSVPGSTCFSLLTHTVSSGLPPFISNLKLAFLCELTCEQRLNTLKLEPTYLPKSCLFFKGIAKRHFLFENFSDPSLPSIKIWYLLSSCFYNSGNLAQYFLNQMKGYGACQIHHHSPIALSPPCQ